MPTAALDLAPARHQLEGMNKYQALRAGPAYRMYATPEQIVERFRPKKIAARPTLLDEERVVDGRVLHIRVEDLGDDRVRASVAVRHKWRKRDFEQRGWVDANLQRRCAELAREVLSHFADVERAWHWGVAWCAEGTRRMDCPCAECSS